MATIVGGEGPAPTAVMIPSPVRPARTLVHQLRRFAVVGCLGTVVSSLLFLVFRTWWAAIPANLAALALSTVVSTEVNRRFTFDGAPAHLAREYVQNAGSVLFYAVYSSAVLVLLAQVVDDPTALQESVTVAVASVLGGAARFLVLRNWVFGGAHAAV
jgi:putative flippase GtrA